MFQEPFILITKSKPGEEIYFFNARCVPRDWTNSTFVHVVHAEHLKDFRFQLHHNPKKKYYYKFLDIKFYIILIYYLYYNCDTVLIIVN